MYSNQYIENASSVLGRHARTVWLLSTIAIAVLIAVLTLTPNPHLPHGGFHWDKLAHMLAFLVLVTPTAALWPRAAAWMGLLAVAYGGAIEIIQPFAGRSAEFADLLADAIGVALGIVLGTILRRVLAARRAGRVR